jgi:excisionase family DNA binding protein
MSAQAEQHALAQALVEVLASSPPAVARLRELLETEASNSLHLEAPAYTVASLALTLGVSARVIRSAISRGELDATKRGGRWIIAASAVRRWAEAVRGDARRRGRVRGGGGAARSARLSHFSRRGRVLTAPVYEVR